MDKNIPYHIGIIPDGNRRWAKAHNVAKHEGHKKGAELAVTIAKYARSRGVHTLTFWALSTENFNREKTEITFLMMIFEHFLDENIANQIGENTRFNHIGRKDRLPGGLRKKIDALSEKTKNFTQNRFNLALDYGGRDEIISAVQKILANGEKEVNETTISNNMYTAGQPDPDLIIRTGGEQRSSGFLPWQSVYSELYFTDLLWPDFSTSEFDKALDDFASRQRRFGK